MLDLFSSLSNALIQFGGGLGLLMGISRYLAFKQRTIQSFLVSLLFISTGTTQLILSGFFSGWLFHFPTFVILLPISLAIYGPIEQYYTDSLLKEKFRFGWVEALHLIPVILILLLISPFFLKSEDLKKKIVFEFWHQNTYETMNLCIYFSAICLTGYNLYLFWIYFRNSKTAPILPAFRLGILLIPFRLIATLLLIYGHYTLNLPSLKIGAVMVSLILIQLYVYSLRNPESLALFIQEVRKNRYERSLLIGLDTDAIQNKLNEFMDQHKLYKREDLTLKELAESVSLSSHQLSEFLNEKKKLNFPSFINQYRILEAQKILIEKPRQTILEIAFEVGFNQKSSFNQAFLRFTGITPKEYRRKVSKL